VETVACPDCDLLQRLPELPPGGKARCARCGHALTTRSPDPIDRPLALTLAAAIALIIANTTPLMGLSAVGRHASTTIGGGAYEMWVQGERLTAAVVAFCAIIAPAGYILFMLTVLLAVRRPPAPRWVGEMLRGAHAMRPWSMNEVMLLGILVALIKIAELATVEPGIGMYAMGALVVLLAAIMATIDPHEIWTRVQWANGDGPSRATGAALGP
jgi:paraquat-inducible protein A